MSDLPDMFSSAICVLGAFYPITSVRHPGDETNIVPVSVRCAAECRRSEKKATGCVFKSGELGVIVSMKFFSKDRDCTQRWNIQQRHLLWHEATRAIVEKTASASLAGETSPSNVPFGRPLPPVAFCHDHPDQSRLQPILPTQSLP